MQLSDDRAATAEQVRQVLASVLKIEVDRVRPEADLVGELGMSSLAMIEANIALERRLGVVAPEVARPDELGIRTVDDLIDHAHALRTGAEVAR